MCDIAQNELGFAFRFRAMSKVIANPDMEALRSTYARALLAFNAASAALIVSFAADVPPSGEVIAAEEKSRAALVAARQQLWAAYRG
jgi:hypothetical protein